MSQRPFHVNRAEAIGNLGNLASNVYPGRGLVMGMTPDEKSLVQIVWIMGRSLNSRNRVYRSDPEIPGRLHTAWAHPEAAGDPSLVIYNAMLENQEQGKYVVSNGHQTDTVLASMVKQGIEGFMPGHANWRYEPDKPNFTPRITGAFSLGSGSWRADFSVLSRLPDGEFQSEYFYTGDIQPGYGSCLTTYTGDGNPLPSFTGGPYTLPFDYDTIESLATQYWGILSNENKVALGVKFIDIDTGKSFVTVRNKV